MGIYFVAMLAGRKTGWSIRTAAVLMTAFYVLAISRGLIPGLCATQAALDAPVANLEMSSGCCSRGDDGVPGVADTGTHCAFCTLVSTAVQAVESPVIPQMPFVKQPYRLDAQSAPDIAVPHDPIQRRGPPVLA